MCSPQEVAGENLNEHFAKKRHDVRRVQRTEPADDADGKLPYLKDFVVQSNEQRGEVLGLREVRIELVVQRHQHAETNVRL